MMIPEAIVLTLAALSLQLGGTQGVEEVSKEQSDPLSVYQKYRAQLVTGPKTRILTTLVGACKSIDGDCDIGSLATLEFMVAHQKRQDLTEYKDYCWEQWLTRCDAQKALGARINQLFKPEQRKDIESLAQRVLSSEEGSSGHLDDIRYRYPKAIVDFIYEKKPVQMADIRDRFLKKENEFDQVFGETVSKVCLLASEGLEANVEALNKWSERKSLEEKDFSWSTRHWLEVYRVCDNIMKNSKSARKYSFNYFRGQQMIE